MRFLSLVIFTKRKLFLPYRFSLIFDIIMKYYLKIFLLSAAVGIVNVLIFFIFLQFQIVHNSSYYTSRASYRDIDSFSNTVTVCFASFSFILF